MCWCGSCSCQRCMPPFQAACNISLSVARAWPCAMLDRLHALPLRVPASLTLQHRVLDWCTGTGPHPRQHGRGGRRLHRPRAGVRLAEPQQLFELFVHATELTPAED